MNKQVIKKIFLNEVIRYNFPEIDYPLKINTYCLNNLKNCISQVKQMFC